MPTKIKMDLFSDDPDKDWMRFWINAAALVTALVIIGSCGLAMYAVIAKLF
jgi:hypothetical protein